MLIDAHTRTIEGPFDLALMVVYAEVVRALRDAGHDETAADQLALRCPGYDPANVKPMSTDEHARLTAEGTARQYHLAPAHPHLFCGCGTEAAACHPGRCCGDPCAYGSCSNCGAPEPEPDPIPESELSDGLWTEV